MRFTIRCTTLIHCGLLLASQQVSAQNNEVCELTQTLGAGDDSRTVAAAGESCLSGCTAKDVPEGTFTLESTDIPSCKLGESITITGTLEYDANADRFDVGLWVGPFADETCNVYGFSCPEGGGIADLDADTCADISSTDSDGSGAKVDTTIFEGVTLTVPCTGDGQALVVNYCFSWQVSGQNEECSGVDGIRVAPGSKCGCDNPFTIPEITACPAKYTVDAACSTDGYTTTLTITSDEDDTFSYAIKEEGDDLPESYTVADTNPVTVDMILESGVDYELVVEGCGVVTLPFQTPCEGVVPCSEDGECAEPKPKCCKNDGICKPEDEWDLTACGDPHMTGFLGQKFDFTGEDGRWYCLIKDDNMQVNMRVTSPVPSMPEITYITGLSVLTTGVDGSEHDLVIEVKDPHNLDSSCPEGVSPCLADGSLSVVLDGEETLFAPGTVDLGHDVQVTAVNLPGACRSFGFEKYWEKKKIEYASADRRRLGDQLSMGEWILADPTATNMDECVEYVARAEVEEDGLFAHQSEHASFQIVTPKAAIRLSHGRLHQIAMRDPTDQYDLPDHLTWQMNMAVDHSDVSRDAKGILGETFVPTRDANGKPIMAGMEAIRGKQEDYRVEGALGTMFIQDAHTS